MRKPKIIPISIGSKSLKVFIFDAMIMIFFIIFGGIIAMGMGTAIMVVFEHIWRHIL